MPQPEQSAALATCEAWLRHGSRSFFWASRLLPRRLRGPIAAIYAFCREADDWVDGQQAGGAAAGEPLTRLRQRLQRVYAAGPHHGPVEQALAVVVRQYALPDDLFLALLEGFAWDRAGRTYATLAEVEAYAARVAGSIGVLLTLLMGERRPAVLARAADLGVAMQLTNIARDVGEDAVNGRLYLPRDWLRQAGIEPQEFLRQPQASLALEAVVARLLDHADVLYRRADVGIGFLPRDCRCAIYAARLLYSRIGRRVRRGGVPRLLRRAMVPWWQKAWLVLRSSVAALWQPRANPWPALPPAAYLLAAVRQP